MPYLSRFEADLFVSYGHLDNGSAGSDEQRWIDRFHADLERRVSQYLGVPVAVWRDNYLNGNHDFSEEIELKLKNAATMIPVVSPRYLHSDWCKRELNAFVRAAEQSGGVKIGTKSRLLKVIKTLVEVKDQPDLMQQSLGYEFYRLDQNGRPRELPDWDPEPDAEKKYLARLDDLAYDLHLLLKEMKAREEALPKPQPAAAQPQAATKTVYLAETTRDLGDVRDQLRREMMARGYVVLPDQSLPLEATDLKQQVTAWLEGCSLSVHLIGSHYSVVPEGDPETRSSVWWQQELAAQRQAKGGFHCVLWMPPGMETSEARQKEFLARLQEQLRTESRMDLLQTSIEDLKNFVFDKLSARPERTPIAEKLESRIYLVCERRDYEAVGPIRDCLNKRGLSVDLPLWDGEQSEIRLDQEATLQDCDGVLLYYGSASEGWLREKIRDLRRARGLGRTRPFVPQGIYIGPDETEAKKLYSNPDFAVIHNFGAFNSACLEPFLAAIEKEQGAAV
jgi:hypothetical protein